MSTMYVCNIPSNETVNLRKTASSSGTILTRVGYGKPVEASVYDSSWHNASYNGYTGYIMSKYLSATDPNGGSSGGATGTTATGTINGTSVRVRTSPSTSASILCQVNTGDVVNYFVGETYSGSGYTWYRCRSSKWTGDGYIASKYVTTSSGSAKYQFIPANAVTYAMNHSDNVTGVPCKSRNTVFTGVTGSNDCADFVHQCLVAGGVPMFNGWFFRLTGIPSSWTDTKWSVTYSGCQKLLGKGWITEVNYKKVQPGDIIYSFDADASPTPYTHVTIAVSENLYSGSKFGCNVCGYTVNQHEKFKELTDSNCVVYRVKDALYGDGTEKRVSLPMTGSGATVL